MLRLEFYVAESLVKGLGALREAERKKAVMAVDLGCL